MGNSICCVDSNETITGNKTIKNKQKPSDDHKSRNKLIANNSYKAITQKKLHKKHKSNALSEA